MGTREEVNEKIKVFASAAKVRTILRHSNIGLLANYNEAMWSTYMDPYRIFTKIGPEMHFQPYSVYGDVIASITKEELKAYCDELA